MTVRLEEMSWPEVKEALNKPNVVILPMGSLEQHGAHLPLNVDTAIATYVAEHAAQKVVDETDIRVLVAPTVVYTDITCHKQFPGTVGLKIDTLIKALEEILSGFIEQGFNNIILFASHLQNSTAMEAACMMIKDKYSGVNIFATTSVFGLGFDVKSATKAGVAGMGHALESETSFSLVIQPQNVHMEKAIIGSRNLPLSSRYIGPDGENKTRGVLFVSGITGNEESGTYGDPRMASKEEGEKKLKAIIGDLADIMTQIAKPGK